MFGRRILGGHPDAFRMTLGFEVAGPEEPASPKSLTTTPTSKVMPHARGTHCPLDVENMSAMFLRFSLTDAPVGPALAHMGDPVPNYKGLT